MSHSELVRLAEDERRERNWKRWGPYLSERQWSTVREDYSANGDSWRYFTHDQARSRAYRWGEDGLLGISDRKGRLAFALALWNERDPILKERLFGLTAWEGNHGEDVKECYYYLDATPTYSYLKGLYKYPQSEYPYEQLLEENQRRSRDDPEFEITDAGVFDDDRYFDVLAEYAKAAPEDILIRITLINRGPEPATLHVLPSLWFRNTWSWGRTGEGYPGKPLIKRLSSTEFLAEHRTLGRYRLTVEWGSDSQVGELLLTENQSNRVRLFKSPNASPYVKDAFHERVISGDTAAVNPEGLGTKAAAWFRLELAPGEQRTLRLRLHAELERLGEPFGAGFDEVFAQRIAEADEFHDSRTPAGIGEDERAVLRQARAGLLWSNQFYYYVVEDWLEGDPGQPPPPTVRARLRNADWGHLYNRDVISMPDAWEYPWYAAWDLAFQMIPMARVDPHFAKQQLVLLLREWYMHPNGQIPAYEFSLSDVNPPVHAWACWRVYQQSALAGQPDRAFLERVFQKLLINFTWWVNRKDIHGRHLFSGGFLGLDNIGVFDRSKPLPGGGDLEQADGTAWMAFYCATMLRIALTLAAENDVYEDIASKFFEHFVAIADAINTLGGTGLWDETDGFYYDQLHMDGIKLPLRVRSMVGLVPLFACEVIRQSTLDRLPGFAKRLAWFLENRDDLVEQIAFCELATGKDGDRLLAIPQRSRLERVLRYVLDEREFLAPYGVRSLSRIHGDRPYELELSGSRYEVRYVPGESNIVMYGGNSNWRGPIWFPLNFLLIEALERYHSFYGDSLRVECPVGSGVEMNLQEVADELARRLLSLFKRDGQGRRPCHGDEARYAEDPNWRDLLLFHEYFHAESGRGLGASHQTGWTALVADLIEDLARER